ncbi:MAG TPA: aminotransferase class III-fold pyridoxal phosphate-dependent enzyme [Acidimicrobiales bacterium]|nr:aminotransferase class III-fold pyridoxal phosphate-dependent enzyme [Acidimicrobiales bacterium]
MTISVSDATTVDWLARDEAALAGVLARTFDIVAVEGRGAWLTDVEARRFLDLTMGIAVNNVGHCHPRVVAAAEAQLHRLVHTSVTVHHERNVELAERLATLCPYLDDAQVFFCNSGAEAVDGAVKLARRATGRPGIVAFRGGFHGRTLGALSLTTAKAKYRDGYEPLVGAVTIAPYAYPLRFGGDAAATTAALAALDELLVTQTPASTVAAMVVEPVLGEGGYVPPPVEWLAGLRERCDRHGILLVFDEVQTGIGRTGRPFAAETFGVWPDVILFAKGVASGLPLGGLIAPRAVMSRWPAATHGSTFGGNPVSCAAALATLDVLDDEGLYERCRVIGARLLADLRRRAEGRPRVREVRGVGMMIGIELGSAATASDVQRRCFDAGALVLTCGPAENVIRVIPPLNLTDVEAEQAGAILGRALDAHG